jgi:hypothetical protein
MTKRQIAGFNFALVVLVTGAVMSAQSQTNVTIDGFTLISTNAQSDIDVTLIPSPISDDLRLEIKCLGGTGMALFLPGYTSVTNIRATSILAIKGQVLSSVECNMTMEARIGGSLLASNIFTVVGTNMITFSQARAIAEQAIVGEATPEPGAPVTVELIGDHYTVTFGRLPPAEPVEDANFRAIVTVQATSGRVTDIEAPP